MFTEDQIRTALAGHFYVMVQEDYAPRVVDMSKPEKRAAHIQKVEKPSRPYTAPGTIDWSDKDETILAMRKAGKQFKQIGHAIGQNPASVQWRFTQLCKRRGLDPTLEFPAYKKYNPQFEAEVVAARKVGETFQSIGNRYGMTKSSVCTLYHRWLSRVNREQAA